MGKSWKLYNIDTGGTEMVKGRMSFRIVEGSVEELTAPLDVVTQRISKCTAEPKFSNRFNDNWGSRAATLIGKKLSPPEIAREIGTDVRLMVAGLIVEQAKVARSVPLAPEETLVRLDSTSVAVVTDTIGVTANVVVGNSAIAQAQTTLVK